MSEARELIEELKDWLHKGTPKEVLDKIETYLSKPEPEPVAYMCDDGFGGYKPCCPAYGLKNTFPVYKNPPARKPLSDDAVYKIAEDNFYLHGETSINDLIKAIRDSEKAHGIGE